MADRLTKCKPDLAKRAVGLGPMTPLTIDRSWPYLLHPEGQRWPEYVIDVEDAEEVDGAWDCDVVVRKVRTDATTTRPPTREERAAVEALRAEIAEAVNAWHVRYVEIDAHERRLG